MKIRSLQSLGSLMQLCVKQDAVIKGVSVDSRSVKPHDLFFALPGNQADGHSFLEEAAKRGASAAVVHTSYKGPDFGLKILPSTNCLLTLQILAKNFLAEISPIVVGITGSVGKTTTKEFLHTLLKKKYCLSYSPGNSNSQIGLPLSILNEMKEEEELIILEMGMTHPGNITQLITIAPPTIALITTIALVHACNFNSLVEIAQAKAEIFSHPRTALGIFAHGVAGSSEIKASGRCQKKTFSTFSAEADFFLQADGQGFKIRGENDESSSFSELHVPGKHNQHNFIAAVAVARNLGLSWEEIQEQKQQLQLPERRLQMIEKKGVLFVNDSYNAAECSLKAALQTLPAPKKGRRKIAVVGEILELGKFSEQCHLEVGNFALDHVDHMICYGNGCAPIYECWQSKNRPVFWTSDWNQLMECIRHEICEGDVVLLKGSRGKQLWKVLDEI